MKYLKWLLLTLVVILFGCGIDAYFIEPHQLINNQITLQDRNSTGKTLKIVQFSDVHINEKTRQDDLSQIVKKINAQKPDIIIFTGDLYDNYYKYHDDTRVIKFLQQLKAKKAKIAVYGNHDSGGGSRYPYINIMAEGGFELLVNDYYSFYLGGKKITLYGLDDALLGTPTWKDVDGDYKILITHEPDIGYETNDNLILSGHTHGGQVKLPFISGKTNLMGDYVRGLYKKGNQYHYIDSGVGMTRLPLRFGVTPQITTINLKL